jgi:hypothetical protein
MFARSDVTGLGCGGLWERGLGIEVKVEGNGQECPFHAGVASAGSSLAFGVLGMTKGFGSPELLEFFRQRLSWRCGIRACGGFCGGGLD